MLDVASLRNFVLQFPGIKMPRIDPIQLLRCLNVLLAENGGIKSKDEVQRLASLMTKFSKKLVSKCIYVHILKNTETELLGLFMGAGGWTLTHAWLTDGILAQNWPLVQELLELLLVCPVDVDRLKSNNCPKLVKDLSKDGSIEVVRILACKLVEQWLKIVKGEITIPLTLSQVKDILNATEFIVETLEPNFSSAPIQEDKCDVQPQVKDSLPKKGAFEFVGVSDENDDSSGNNSKENTSSKTNEALPILKISVKDGKQMVSKIKESSIEKKQSESDKKSSVNKDSKNKEINRVKDERTKSKDKSREKDRNSKHSSSKSLDSKHSKSSIDGHHKNNSTSSKAKDSGRSKGSKSSPKDSKHSEKRKDKESDKHKNQDKHKSSSENRKDKEKKVKQQSEKNKETLEKLQPVSLSKLGKIPKISPDNIAKEKVMEVKKEKPSISIEVRKPSDANRPKTVKMFNSKFRSHGLEEEAKRPPPRGAAKKSTPPPMPPPPLLASAKRPSPPRITDAPPEKKPKISEHIDKPGAIKLIAPIKPKLLESDMFMDALTASATNKKEPKKRKRRTSGSKDGLPNGDASPPSTPTTPTDLNDGSKSSAAPPRFYQDTLETEEDKKHEKIADVKEEANEKSPEAADITIDEPQIDEKTPFSSVNEISSPERNLESNPPGLKSVLTHHKKSGQKKTVRWRTEEELEEIQYFELDENERVNVTRTFTDMMHLEKSNEREAFRKCRNLVNDDIMEEKMSWRPLIVCDSDATYVEYGKNSKEKDIQTAREKTILPALYFNKSIIPETPFEADVGNYPTTDPVIIPLEDVTGNGNADSVNDYRKTPWPEPKQAPPMLPNSINMPPMFPPMPPFPPGFPPNAPFAVPGFPPNPAMMTGDWSNGPPGLIMPPEAMTMGPDMFPGNNPMFPGPMPPNGFPIRDMSMNMGMNGPMFPPRFPLPGPGVGMPVMPTPPFNVNNSNNSNRGGIRNLGPRGQNTQFRQKGPGSWKGPRGGGAGSRGILCTYFQTKGYCRQGDKCHYLHPGVNCPF